MTYFDTDGDGTVNFDEFLVGVRVSKWPVFTFNLNKKYKISNRQFIHNFTGEIER
jgi:hypothetical protein